MYAAIKLLTEDDSYTNDSLRSALVERKNLGANQPDSEEGAEDVIKELQNALLLLEDDDNIRLTADADVTHNSELLYSGKEVSESIQAADDTEAYERILTNLTYAHPELLSIAKEVYRNKPLEKYEIKRQLAGLDPFGNKLNDFTIDVGINLLTDADVLRKTDRGYVDGTCPITLLAHILYEEYEAITGNDNGVTEQELFERLELMYGVEKSTFEKHLSRLERAGFVTPSSYGELTIDKDAFTSARIHE
ncbi:hypothetical protein NDI56_11235 [Haloarcula sp. S1CR25-12]|uniref:Uncharacterized protein n=1 Tax=Haloarcula saliterrae TaxID=2950534 RepID=A0ABU2FDE7_9EURY|nr:hypothetical protein [Haloarcula sp. S1CR25-12]MDS0259968.1 hypothetical protein [Haloarcula sp. S1CR25-12]